MTKNGEFLVFMEAEDSAAGLVKVATQEKVYKCVAVCSSSWKGKNTLISQLCMPEFYYGVLHI